MVCSMGCQTWRSRWEHLWPLVAGARAMRGMDNLAKHGRQYVRRPCNREEKRNSAIGHEVDRLHVLLGENKKQTTKKRNCNLGCVASQANWPCGLCMLGCNLGLVFGLINLALIWYGNEP